MPGLLKFHLALITLIAFGNSSGAWKLTSLLEILSQH